MLNLKNATYLIAAPAINEWAVADLMHRKIHSLVVLGIWGALSFPKAA
jgi:hypothetical protein